MGYYSEIMDFSDSVAPQEKTVMGKTIYAKKFTARSTATYQGIVTQIAIATKSGHMEGYADMCSDLKWHVIKNSLCDSEGNLISNADLDNLRDSSALGMHDFLEECYKHCQVVNEIGIHGRIAKDKDGKDIVDEVTGKKKSQAGTTE